MDDRSTIHLRRAFVAVCGGVAILALTLVSSWVHRDAITDLEAAEAARWGAVLVEVAAAVHTRDGAQWESSEVRDHLGSVAARHGADVVYVLDSATHTVLAHAGTRGHAPTWEWRPEHDRIVSGGDRLVWWRQGQHPASLVVAVPGDVGRTSLLVASMPMGESVVRAASRARGVTLLLWIAAAAVLLAAWVRRHGRHTAGLAVADVIASGDIQAIRAMDVNVGEGIRPVAATARALAEAYEVRSLKELEQREMLAMTVRESRRLAAPTEAVQRALARWSIAIEAALRPTVSGETGVWAADLSRDAGHLARGLEAVTGAASRGWDANPVGATLPVAERAEAIFGLLLATQPADRRDARLRIGAGLDLAVVGDGQWLDELLLWMIDDAAQTGGTLNLSLRDTMLVMERLPGPRRAKQESRWRGGRVRGLARLLGGTAGFEQDGRWLVEVPVAPWQALTSRVPRPIGLVWFGEIDLELTRLEQACTALGLSLRRSTDLSTLTGGEIPIVQVETVLGSAIMAQVCQLGRPWLAASWSFEMGEAPPPDCASRRRLSLPIRQAALAPAHAWAARHAAEIQERANVEHHGDLRPVHAVLVVGRQAAGLELAMLDAGWRTVRVEAVSEAVALHAEEHFSVILVHWSFPEGDTLMHAIRRLPGEAGQVAFAGWGAGHAAWDITLPSRDATVWASGLVAALRALHQS